MPEEHIAQDYQLKAATLTEALPWIQNAWGKVVVIKYGGAAMVDEALCQQVADDIVLMKLAGVHPVVIHGGGPEISAFQERLGLPVRFHEGLRVTPPEVMEIVKMVLVGKVNKRLVNAINAHGAYAVGLSGEDGRLLTGRTIDPELGRAGEISHIDTTIVKHLIDDDCIPVIASCGCGEDGESLNINADTAASALAAALGADKCFYLTDVNGLYRDAQNPATQISRLTISQARAFSQKEAGSLGGMAPKLDACINAVEGGTRRSYILNGTLPHALILEMYTTAGIGTMITRDEEGELA